MIVSELIEILLEKDPKGKIYLLKDNDKTKLVSVKGGEVETCGDALKYIEEHT